MQIPAYNCKLYVCGWEEGWVKTRKLGRGPGDREKEALGGGREDSGTREVICKCCSNYLYFNK